MPTAASPCPVVCVAFTFLWQIIVQQRVFAPHFSSVCVSTKAKQDNIVAFKGNPHNAVVQLMVCTGHIQTPAVWPHSFQDINPSGQ